MKLQFQGRHALDFLTIAPPSYREAILAEAQKRRYSITEDAFKRSMTIDTNFYGDGFAPDDLSFMEFLKLTTDNFKGIAYRLTTKSWEKVEARQSHSYDLSDK